MSTPSAIQTAKYLVRTALLGCVLAALPGTAAAVDVVIGSGDDPCPAGYSLLSVGEAQANQTAVCNELGTWDIARLAGGGAMDGAGYGCGIRSSDTRVLGDANAAVGAVIRVQDDCAQARPLIPAAEDALRTATERVRTPTGRTTLDGLRNQLRTISLNCP